jgi:hypothetical protein
MAKERQKWELLLSQVKVDRQSALAVAADAPWREEKIAH